MHSNSTAPCSIALFSKNSCFKRKLLFNVSQRQLNFTLKVAIGFVETFRNIKYSCIWFSKIQDSKGIHRNSSNVNIFNIYHYNMKYGHNDKLKCHKGEQMLGKSPFSSRSYWVFMNYFAPPNGNVQESNLPLGGLCPAMNCSTSKVFSSSISCALHLLSPQSIPQNNLTFFQT